MIGLEPVVQANVSQSMATSHGTCTNAIRVFVTAKMTQAPLVQSLAVALARKRHSQHHALCLLLVDFSTNVKAST